MSEPPEVWRPVVGYERAYEVSNLGNIYSTRNEKIVRSVRDKDGYRIILLYVAGKIHRKRVHRLVLEAFVGPSNGRLALHSNDVRDDNRLQNLYWGTSLDNHRDSVAHGTFAVGSAHKNSKLTEAAVREIRKLRRAGVTIKVLASTFKVTAMAIQKAAVGETWRHVK